MNKVSLETRECGEWQQLYFNGVLIAENHSLDAYNVLESLKDRLNFEFEEKEINCQECGEDCD